MSTPLQQLLSKVLFDPFTRSDFGADPAAFLRDNGWSTLEGPELEEAVAALGDALPVETAEALDSACHDVDFSSESLREVGGMLADVANQVDPELPTDLEPAETDLSFGAGAEGTDRDVEADVPTDANDIDEPGLDDIGRGLGDTSVDDLDEGDSHDGLFGIDEEVDPGPVMDDVDDLDATTDAYAAPDIDIDLEG